MKAEWIILTIVISAMIVGLGLAVVPTVFAERIMLGMRIGAFDVSGISKDDLGQTLTIYDNEIKSRKVTLHLRDKEKTYTAEELGFALDIGTTKENTIRASKNIKGIFKEQIVRPTLSYNKQTMNEVIENDFGDSMALPTNASLELTGKDKLIATPSIKGEQINAEKLAKDMTNNILNNNEIIKIELTVNIMPASVQDDEIAQAKATAEKMMNDGYTLTFGGEDYTIRPYSVRRLLAFVPQIEPNNHDNEILGTRFDSTGIRSYFTETLLPAINQEPINARFISSSGRVEQFSIAQRGQEIDIDDSIEKMASALAQGRVASAIQVKITEPEITSDTSIQELGLTSLIATGTTDYTGSPKNRIHNSSVGAHKYHGLLIAPGEEFSFNKFLGPVTAATGFLPELVIKHNVTTPEYGGGLCQVSTTMFRAAVRAGMEITTRRNHAYAVSYYGKPGFDATIYPPYTDFRFLNNTPGYILIQQNISGTKLTFEIWGTDDGRIVEIVGPNTYDRQSNGAVKASLAQKVTIGENVLIDESFYSNYKSPNLFPKVLAANNEKVPEGEAEEDKKKKDEPAKQPKPEATPTPNPKTQDKDSTPEE